MLRPDLSNRQPQASIAAVHPRLELACDGRFANGARALLWILPPEGRPCRAALVCVQPFAEEANLSRRLIVTQARRLAARGIAVVIPDLFGTGDSAGEFEQATLPQWTDDIAIALSLTAARLGLEPALWGVRFGALLAAHCAHDGRATALLTWHPIRDGGQPVAQYRRLAKLRGLKQAPASAIANQSAPTRAALSSESATHEPAACLELAGYRLSAQLIEQMQSLTWPKELPCSVLEVEPGGQAGDTAVAFWHALDAPDDEALFKATEHRLEDWLSRQATDAPKRGDRSTDSGWPGSAASMQAGQAGASLDAAAERAVSFDAPSDVLRGIVHAGAGSIGVVIVPGQPQTRVGSHRMFVQLARALAAAGYPTLRYDLAGYGDSDGIRSAYDATPADVAAAVAALRAEAPQVQRVVLWGLCDGATAAALASDDISQLAGLVLANPWVHDESLRARALVDDHYRGRIASAAFWRRLLTGGVRIGPAIVEAAGHMRRALAPRRTTPDTPAERLLRVLQTSRASVALLLSGQDLTAGEMNALLASDERWARVAGRLSIEPLPQADHTMSRSDDLRRAVAATIAFLDGLRPASTL